MTQCRYHVKLHIFSMCVTNIMSNTFHSDWVLPLAFRTLKCVGAAIWPAQLEGHPAPFRLQTWHESIMMSRLGKGKKTLLRVFFEVVRPIQKMETWRNMKELNKEIVQFILTYPSYTKICSLCLKSFTWRWHMIVDSVNPRGEVSKPCTMDS